MAPRPTSSSSSYRPALGSVGMSFSSAEPLAGFTGRHILSEPASRDVGIGCGTASRETGAEPHDACRRTRLPAGEALSAAPGNLELHSNIARAREGVNVLEVQCSAAAMGGGKPNEAKEVKGKILK